MNLTNNSYPKVFGCALQESVVEFGPLRDPICPICSIFGKKYDFFSYFLFKPHDFQETQYGGGFEVVVYDIYIEFLELPMKYSIWWIQYGGHKIMKNLIFPKLCACEYLVSLIADLAFYS